VGPLGRTGLSLAIDRAAGLSKDESPWLNTALTVSSSSVRSHRSFSRARRSAKRYDLSRNLIRIWVQRFEAGALDEDAVAADLIEQYEARIAALERLVGEQALELEFVKGALKSAPRQKSAPTSVFVGLAEAVARVI
jgi:hypothetical protein